jgi:recombination protein RecR
MPGRSTLHGMAGKAPSRSSVRGGDSPQPSAYPAPVAALIEQFAALPGIGRRSAERLALHVLKAPAEAATRLAGAITSVKTHIRNCGICANLTDAQTCAICLSAKRDAGMILVVEQPRDLLAIEATGFFSGVYHVLLGHLSPLDGIGPGDLTIADLLSRVRTPATNSRGEPVREVILGLSPTLEGDGTTLYLTEQLQAAAPKLKLSRLARGLPSGSQLDLAPKAVLADALHSRTRVE